MSRPTPQDLAARFHRLHAREGDSPLVLPNAWDVVSARLVEEPGARAIATTSAGIAWAQRYPDGQRTPPRRRAASSRPAPSRGALRR